MSEKRPPALISHVEIENFKAVKHAEIDLKPLTAVVGVNSSGKSTFIQAVLLIVQHLRDEYSTEMQYSLNEDLVQLGSFAETARRTGTEQSDEIRISLTSHRFVTWEVVLESEQSSDSRFARTKSLRVTEHLSDPDKDSSIPESEVIIDSILEPEHAEYREIDSIPINGDRDQVRIVTGQTTFNGATTVLRYVHFAQGELPTFMQQIHLSELAGESAERDFSMMKDTEWGSRFTLKNKDDQVSTRPMRVTQNSEKPLARFERKLLEFIEKISDVFEDKLDDDDSLQKLQSLDEQVSRYVRLLQGAILRSLLEAGDFLKAANVTPLQVAQVVRDSVKKVLGARDLVILSAPSRSSSPQARSFLSRAFNQVHYLGPIRDIDRPYSGSFTRRSLGIHGEHCATVLQRESKEKVANPPLPPGNTEVHAASRFAEILNAWMQYLDLVDEVQVEDRGRLKAGIKIVPRRGSQATVSVHSVGVGVAQVLPVVMQCILAEPNRSITVIEQPELHLHPSIEVKLADFLVACARSGRQIFIETHSEHLINRLRLEIARDESGDTRELVSVLFANQDEETGITAYENAVINEVGGIEGGWPDDFLDLSTEESLTLLQVALRRRQREQFAGSEDDDDDF